MKQVPFFRCAATPAASLVIVVVLFLNITGGNVLVGQSDCDAYPYIYNVYENLENMPDPTGPVEGNDDCTMTILFNQI